SLQSWLRRSTLLECRRESDRRGGTGSTSVLAPLPPEGPGPCTRDKPESSAVPDSRPYRAMVAQLRRPGAVLDLGAHADGSPFECALFLTTDAEIHEFVNPASSVRTGDSVSREPAGYH